MTAATHTDTMSAIVQSRYGEADNLSTATLPLPTPRKGEVLIEVKAAALNPADVFLMRGIPRMLRLTAGLTRPRQPVPGSDVAGVVTAVGPGVTQWKVGDEVFGAGSGSLAQYATARADWIARIPQAVTFEHAAATVMAGLAALHGLRAAGLKAGQKVLIVGAAGGIGSFAVQLAHAAGAHVTAVCSARKASAVSALGADAVVAYDEQSVTEALGSDPRERFDIIFDNAGANPMTSLMKLTTPTGVVLPNAGVPGPDGGALRRVLKASLRRLILRQRYVTFYSAPKQADLEELGQRLAKGDITPLIGTLYPLAHAPEGMARVASGHARGKVVVTP